METKNLSKWIPESFHDRIRKLKDEGGDIPKFLVQVVDDIMEEMANHQITKYDGICLNPVIEDSFNYQLMEETLGTEETINMVHLAIKELRTRPKLNTENTFDILNLIMFNGLIPEY